MSFDMLCLGHISPSAASLMVASNLYLLGPAGIIDHHHPLGRTLGISVKCVASREHSNGEMTYAAGLSFAV